MYLAPMRQRIRELIGKCRAHSQNLLATLVDNKTFSNMESIRCVRSEKNLSDAFTKPLPEVTLLRLRSQLLKPRNF